MTGRRLRRGLAALGLAVAAIACGPAAPPPPNVVLVSIDTLRADHLGCYGYPRDTSPSLDRLAADAVLFEQALAAAPSTLPSHASMFTSRIPSRHGALFGRRQALDEAHTTLAEVLRGHGYRTAAIHGGGQMRRRWQLYQGFDFRERVHTPGSPRFAATVEAARAWLERHGDDGPFFLFLHSYETHHPYRPAPEHLARFADPDYAGPLPDRIELDEHLRRMNGERQPPLDWTPADLAHVVAAYDAEIRSMDDALGELVAALRRLGLYEDALIAFTSDHGEEFGEHGRVGWHGLALFEEQLRVPLVIKLPGGARAGTRVAGLARGIDLAPTLLAALGLPPAASFEGVDRLGDGPPPEVAIAQHEAPEGALPTAVRTERWKLVGDVLYDLAADPGETRDVADRHPEVVRRLADVVRRLAARRPDAPGDAPRVELDDEDRAQLRALGYLD